MAAEVARAERALEVPVTRPAQELVVVVGTNPEVPPVGPLESDQSPSLVRISAEELALIIAFWQALDNKNRID
jgi:hypothetical protein